MELTSNIMCMDLKDFKDEYKTPFLYEVHIKLLKRCGIGKEINQYFHIKYKST